RSRFDVSPAVERDLAQASGLVVRPHREAVHAVLLRAFDAESLAGKIEVPFSRGPEEADHVEQVRVRLQSVTVANEVLGRRDPERGAAQHDEGPVEAPPVERDETVETR